MKSPVTVSITFLVETPCMPGAEEWRMLAAIAQTAVQEAGRHGEYRAAFHGFHIFAQRWPNAWGNGIAIVVLYEGAGIATCAVESFVTAQVI